MGLLSCPDVHDKEEILLHIADQINRGSPCTRITSVDLRIDIAKLNHRAGKKTMAQSDFAKAKSYLDSAKSLLPKNYWSSQYSLSIQLFMSLANAAYSCGDKEAAEAALCEIISNGRTLGMFD